MVDVVFAHGWGFDRHVWQDVVGSLEGITPHYIDFGYIGDSQPQTDIVDNAILVGHSLGVMWLLKHAPKTTRGFVSIAGFDHFMRFGDEGFLTTMKRNLDRNPAAQMQMFLSHAGTPEIRDVNYNVDRLKEGLGWLLEWDASKKLANLSCPITSLASCDDMIVSKKASEKIWNGYDVHWIGNAGHILPQTASAFCVRYIQNMVNDVR